MVSKMIITNNEEALRVKCEDVSLNEVASLIDTLEAELKEANRLGKGGIGLAAPQIGIAKNIAIIRLEKPHNFSLNLVNCRIEKGFDSTIFRQEGCLSFPGRTEDTARFQEVHVVSNLVEPHSFIASGFLAVACQHEIDHLNSTLFYDHLVKKQVSIINKNKIGPNDPCFCGKIDVVLGRVKKYKKCCGRDL